MNRQVPGDIERREPAHLMAGVAKDDEVEFLESLQRKGYRTEFSALDGGEPADSEPETS